MKMKKIFILLCLVCILGLTGCGTASKTKATIIDNDNNKVQMTLQELYDLESENQSAFKNKYFNAKINFTATVEQVKSNVVRLGSSKSYDEIIFKEGWDLYLPYGEYDSILENLAKGDKLSIQTTIYTADTVGINSNDTVIEKVK